MSWAAQRRLVILVIIGLAAVAFLATVSLATFYKTPSCADGVQNQGESGIDCGGPCAYLCTAGAQAPTVLFTKALQNGSGQVDIIASVENKNAAAAARAVPYRIMLYGADRTLIREVTGTFDLPPGATIPVFVPNVPVGQQTAGSSFLTIDPSAVRWFLSASDERIVPKISGTTLGGATDAPRVEAVIANPNAVPLTDLHIIVIARAAGGGIVGASRTIIPSLPARGNATAVFTWGNAFPGIPASFEVIPIVPLPASAGGEGG